MSLSPYKAIVFDLDGTAIPNRRDSMPSPLLIGTIREAKSRLHLIAATARPISLALPVIQALGLKDPCVISGGTTLIDPTSGKILRQAKLTQDQLDAITKVCSPLPYNIGTDDEPPEDRLPAAQRRLTGNVSIIYIPRVESQDLTNLIQALCNIPGVLATSTKAWTGGHVIHVTTADGSKEHGIRHVLEQIKVSPPQAIGVGDGDNDIHLFAAIGHRVAMGNASDQLKSVADEIAPSVDEDGLAWVIKKYSNT